MALPFLSELKVITRQKTFDQATPVALDVEVNTFIESLEADPVIRFQVQPLPAQPGGSGLIQVVVYSYVIGTDITTPAN